MARERSVFLFSAGLGSCSTLRSVHKRFINNVCAFIYTYARTGPSSPARTGPCKERQRAKRRCTGVNTGPTREGTYTRLPVFVLVGRDSFRCYVRTPFKPVNRYQNV